jgi:hypothetical protein
MCIGSSLNLNQIQASATSSFLNYTNNTSKPVEVRTKAEPKVVAYYKNKYRIDIHMICEC